MEGGEVAKFSAATHLPSDDGPVADKGGNQIRGIRMGNGARPCISQLLHDGLGGLERHGGQACARPVNRSIPTTRPEVTMRGISAFLRPAACKGAAALQRDAVRGRGAEALPMARTLH